MAERIGKAEFEEKVLKSDLPVLVDFYSDSCIACKKLTPALGDAEDELEGQVRFYKVNTNFEEELTETYEILSRPTLVLVKNGAEAGRLTGAVKAQELISWIRTYVQG